MQLAPVTPALRVRADGLEVARGLVPPGSVVDVLIDEHRVWSLAWPAPTGDTSLVPWPSALRPHLHGVASFALRVSSTGRVVARARGVLADDHERLTVTDENGRRLAVGKWGHLVPTFEGLDDGGDAAVRRVTEVVGALEDFGVNAFMCYGTLLGAVRDGDLLPHDDDFDLAYLSVHDHPADVAAEQLKIKRHLAARFGEVVSHSLGHLTLSVDTGGGTSMNVDVFTAFVLDDDLHLPFHVQVPRHDVPLETLTRMQLRGVDLPAPAAPHALLEATYGPSWRIPDPSFTFQTPVAAERRFTGWLGSFHHPARQYWEDHYSALSVESAATSQPPSPLAILLGTTLPLQTPVIDVGAGSGADALHLARLGFHVTAFDVARNAMAALSSNADAEGLPVKSIPLNLEDLSEGLSLIADLDPSAPPCVLVTDVLPHLTQQARSHLWILVGAVAALGGTTWVQTPRSGSPEVTGQVVSAVQSEAISRGLRVRGARPAVTSTPADATTWLEISRDRPLAGSAV